MQLGQGGGLGGEGPGRRGWGQLCRRQDTEAEQAGSWREEAGPSLDFPAQASGGAAPRRRAQDRHFLPPVPGSAGGADRRPRTLLPAAPCPARPSEPAQQQHSPWGTRCPRSMAPPSPGGHSGGPTVTTAPGPGPAAWPHWAHMLGSPTLCSVGPTDHNIPGSGFAISWDNSAPLSMNHKLQTTVLSPGALSWPRLGR